jgi:uncharacterized protein (DUF1778 family)
MQTLSAAHRGLIDQAATLLPVSSRKLFVLHMVGVAADERVTTDERFYQQLCDALARFSKSARPDRRCCAADVFEL